MDTIYIYDTQAQDKGWWHIATITGESTEAVEAKARELGWDDGDRYGWTSSPACGTGEGLIPNPEAQDIDIANKIAQ